MESEKNIILKTEGLSVWFRQKGRGFRQRILPGVRDLNLEIRRGEIAAVVGSSGSGKSLLAHAVMGILPYNACMSGTILFRGEPLTGQRLKKIRGRELVLVPQSVSYLDPLMKVGEQVTKGNRSSEAEKRMKQVFSRYGLETGTEKKYPFELSGGMTRRILISAAVMEKPDLVIADEPTPGLHMEAARQVMEHFREMAENGAGILLITHDLELAMKTADRICVLYGGQTVEEAPAGDFLHEERLKHPYARALCRSMPASWDTEGARLCSTGDILKKMREEFGR